MKKSKYYMTFYDDLALLHSIYNKQTLFFSGMLKRMDDKQVVQMTSYTRREIISEIGSKATDPLSTARQYLKTLSDGGLVANIGGGAYMVNPKVHGFNNMQASIDKKMQRFIEIKYAKGKRTISAGETK